MEQNKELEKLVDKIFEADKPDSPSMGFTNQVLSQIEALKSSEIKFKPLLPKWVLGLVALTTSVFIWYILKTDQTNTDSLNLLPNLNANALITEFFNQFSFSSSLGYSLLAIGIVSCVQAVLFTRKINRRIA